MSIDTPRLGALFPPAWHRPWFRYVDPVDGAEAGSDPAPKPEAPAESPAAAFTQSDVDRIVKERVARVEQKYADYADLKAKAEGAKTTEDRLAALEQQSAAAEARALRAEVAAEFGISTKKGAKGEPSDADLFLTGTDLATLTAQAQRLTARDVDRKKQGNVAPQEGETKTKTSDGKDGLREFARELFGRDD